MNEPAVEEIGVADAAAAIQGGDGTLVDVREDVEWRAGHAVGARHIPLMQLPRRLEELDRASAVYLICRTDNRSRRAAEFLAQQGFVRPIVVRGGTLAWHGAGLPLSQED